MAIVVVTHADGSRRAEFALCLADFILENARNWVAGDALGLAGLLLSKTNRTRQTGRCRIQVVVEEPNFARHACLGASIHERGGRPPFWTGFAGRRSRLVLENTRLAERIRNLSGYVLESSLGNWNARRGGVFVVVIKTNIAFFARCGVAAGECIRHGASRTGKTRRRRVCVVIVKTQPTRMACFGSSAVFVKKYAVIIIAACASSSQPKFSKTCSCSTLVNRGRDRHAVCSWTICIDKRNAVFQGKRSNVFFSSPSSVSKLECTFGRRGVHLKAGGTACTARRYIGVVVEHAAGARQTFCGPNAKISFEPRLRAVFARDFPARGVLK